MDSLDEIPPYRLFAGIGDEAWRWLLIEGREQCPFLDRYLPGLPGDPEFEARFVGTSGNEALTYGFDAYALVRDLYVKYAGPLAAGTRVLDFGCGWGRVTRFFLKDVASENLVGIDSNPDAVRSSSRTNRWADFRLCDPVPPTTLKAESFALVYAISVFSHLSEERHRRWLGELERLLAPGGVLVLTTFGPIYLALLSEDASKSPEESSSLQELRSAYDSGRFCFRRLKEMPDPHFGETFIPEQYVREHWTELFVVQDYFEAPSVFQTVIVCTKR